MVITTRIRHGLIRLLGGAPILPPAEGTPRPWWRTIKVTTTDLTASVALRSGKEEGPSGEQFHSVTDELSKTLRDMALTQEIDHYKGQDNAQLQGGYADD